jgi:acetyltransferase-like isoleucine patch superfamily enzyme
VRRTDLLFGLVFVAPPFLKKVLLRAFLGARIAPTAHLGWFSSVRARTLVMEEHSSIAALTLVRCDGDVRLGRYAEVSSFVLCYGAGGFALGDHAYVGPQCLINADEDVRLGHHSALGPRSMVFTHGSFLPVTEGYPVRLAGVTIGDRAWLAAGVFLHPGVRVGDDVIVNSRAVVAGDIPSGMVAEGSPARPVFPVERVKRRMTPARVDETMRRVLARFAEVVLERSRGLRVTTEGRDAVRFTAGGCAYRIVYLPATGPATEPAPPPGDGRKRLIVLSNAAGWRPAAGAEAGVLDLVTGRFGASDDPMARELAEFLRRYYGIRLEHPPASAASVELARPVPSPTK